MNLVVLYIIIITFTLNNTMSLSREELINSIYKKYGVRFDKSTSEKTLLEVFSGKYHRVEVLNIAKRGKASKFDKSDLRTISTNDLKRLAHKYSKSTIPSGLPREVIEQILLKKLNPNKLSDDVLRKFGKSKRGSLTNAAGLYGGMIPKVRKKLADDDLKRGREAVKNFK